MKVREVIHLLEKNGWKEMRSKGQPRYSAFSPDVPGCAAVGDTKEETRRNFQEALAAHFEAMRDIGEPIPEPCASVDYVEVAA